MLRCYLKDVYNWNLFDDRLNLCFLGVKILMLNNGIEVKILNKSFLMFYSVNFLFCRIYSLILWGYLIDLFCLRMRVKINVIF